jgi:3-mercaptopropionate dioxygenase
VRALRAFVGGIGALVEAAADGAIDEGVLLTRGGDLLAELVRRDDWLPDEFARPGMDYYGRYLLHCDSRERFSIMSCVWGPGQSTPIHDHPAWGLVGILRGAEREERFVRNASELLRIPERILRQGTVGAISPRDVHRVSNAYADRTSIGIHVYGANMAAIEHSIYDVDGAKRTVSGSKYDNQSLPNLWDS